MKEGFTVNVEGFAQISQDLRNLAQILRSDIVRGGMAEVAAAIRDEAIAQAPERAGPEGSPGGPPPGNLKRSIYSMRLPEDSTINREVWKVDIRMGKNVAWTHKRNKDRPLGGTAYYGQFVEYGHWSRTPAAVLQGGKDRGKRDARRKAYQQSGKATWIPANPFMRRAYERTRARIPEILRSYIKRNMARALRNTKRMKAAEATL